MKKVTLGSTGIVVPQNGFGALPIQRIGKEEAIRILRKARSGGITFFDTARAYSDSEEKIGEAFQGDYSGIYIASKTHALTPEDFWKDLQTSLRTLKTETLDLYQFHQADNCFKPGDGTGMYECMTEAKQKGMIRHIGITTHKLSVARQAIASGLYETLQFPFSYLATETDIALVRECENANMGFIAMKAISGGLLTNAEACMAFMTQFDNVVPIWGIQRESELDQWLSFFSHEPVLTDNMKETMEADRDELQGSFCRGCGYCMPCTVGIKISECARMIQMIRRLPSANFLTPEWQKEMLKIDQCVECGRCMTRCPYHLPITTLLKRSCEDYKRILSGETKL